MRFIVISGFYPEPNPDNSLQYERAVPPDLESAVLTTMGWTSLAEVPMGENDLTQDQAQAVMKILNDPVKDNLAYSIGLFS